METVKASFQWTRAELVSSYRNHYQLFLSPFLKIIVNVTAVVLLLISLVVLVFRFKFNHLLFPIGCISWLFFRRQILEFLLSSGFDQRPDSNKEMRWEFNEEGIATETPGFGEAKRTWISVFKVRETKDGFLIYGQKNIFNWLPFSAFESSDDIETVRGFIKGNNVKFEETS